MSWHAKNLQDIGKINLLMAEFISIACNYCMMVLEIYFVK